MQEYIQQLAAKDAEIAELKNQSEQDTRVADVWEQKYLDVCNQHEQALKENESLKQQLSERKGMQWVKASERIPTTRKQTALRVSGSIYCGYFNHMMNCFFLNTKEPEERSIEDVEWLDESSPLPDARQEAIYFAQWVYKNKWFKQSTAEEDMDAIYNLYLNEKEANNG
jgi:YesN/AraC family two-component response regulator